MFLITRVVNEKTEILKDTVSNMAKTFPTSTSADKFCKKLNNSVTPDKHWKVKRSDYC